MATRLDDLFDPERLRTRWTAPAGAAAEAAPRALARPEPAVASEVLDKLESTVHAAHPSRKAAFVPLFARARALVQKRFPAEGAPGADEVAAVKKEMEPLLDSIEDLLDAFELRRA